MLDWYLLISIRACACIAVFRHHLRNESSDLPAEPHIRIVKGAQAKGEDPYSWETYETISTHGMDYLEVRDRLEEYGIKVPTKPHDDI